MSVKVVVFDDKPLIRKAIIKYIDWEKLNCVVAGHADNGLDGERLIMEEKPDIIISDIKMPGKDGLELARLAKEVIPDVRVILITGYQEFEFAQKAVKVGAFDFILKPISYPDLEKTIQMAVCECNARKNRQLEQALLQKKLQDSQPLLRSKFVLDSIVGGRRSAIEESGEDRARQLGMARYVPYALIMIRPKKALQVLSARSVSHADKLLRVLDEYAESVDPSYDRQAITAMVNGDAVAIVHFERPGKSGQSLQAVSQYCRLLQLKASNEMEEPCLVVASSCYDRLDDLQQAYFEAFVKMESLFFELDALAAQEAASEGSLFNDLIQFIYNLEQLEKSDISAALTDMMRRISVSAGGNKGVARGFLVEICFALRRFYVHKFGSEFGLNKSADELIDDVHSLTDLNEAFGYIMEQVEEVKARLSGSTPSYSPVVKQVQAFIAAHYAKDLSLSYVASQFDINPSYLSRIVSQETGIPFVELVARTRINAAKRLLRDSLYRVNEVSEMVGYKDYNYFYRIFKKIEGISPTEYKRE